MPRELKCWNGRGYCCCVPSIDKRWRETRSGSNATVYVCGYSREDARRVIEEYCGTKPSIGEIRDYFSDVWGVAMNGITPERGLWIQFNYLETPVRVV